MFEPRLPAAVADDVDVVTASISLKRDVQRLVNVAHPIDFTKRGYTNKRSPFDYFKTNILVDTMGFSAVGVRAAIEMCGVDRVVFGSDFGPVPYGIKEHVKIVEEVLPSSAERELVFWKTSNRVFRLGLVDIDLIAPAVLSAVA